MQTKQPAVLPLDDRFMGELFSAFCLHPLDGLRFSTPIPYGSLAISAVYPVAIRNLASTFGSVYPTQKQVKHQDKESQIGAVAQGKHSQENPPSNRNIQQANPALTLPPKTKAFLKTALFPRESFTSLYMGIETEQTSTAKTATP